MKRFVAGILAVLLLLGLCACGGEETPQETENTLLIGIGKADITPEENVPMSGFSGNRVSTGVLTRLYATCIAMSDGTGTVLLYSQDLHYTTSVLTPTLRANISAKLPAEYKIRQENIYIASTGTYYGPNMKSADQTITNYQIKYTNALIAAAREALEDMTAATLYQGTAQTEGLSFVHHYTMDDGTVEDGYYGFLNRDITGHAAQPDKTMYLVKAEREDKPSVLLINWQCLPLLSGEAETRITADFVGHLRDKVEADTGMKAVYFSGAMGDISPVSLLSEENHNLDAQSYGEKLAQIAEAAIPSLSALETGGVGSYMITYSVSLNHEDDDKLEEANKVLAERKANGDYAADQLAKKLGLKSVYTAAMISKRKGWKEKDSVEVAGIRVGGFGIAMAPCKLFGSTGEKIRENAPTEMTFVLCEANAAWPVIASEEAFAYGCYEAYTSTFARGTAEKMANAMTEMLIMSRK